MQRADHGLDGVSPHFELDRQLVRVAAPFEHRFESDAQIVDDLVAEIEPGSDPGQNELGDALETLVARDREHDPVRRHSSPAPTTTFSSYRTTACPVATPYAGASSISRKPCSVSSTAAGTAGDRYRHLTSARFTGTYNRPRA